MAEMTHWEVTDRIPQDPKTAPLGRSVQNPEDRILDDSGAPTALLLVPATPGFPGFGVTRHGGRKPIVPVYWRTQVSEKARNAVLLGFPATSLGKGRPATP
jgi:hypothetical protein